MHERQRTCGDSLVDFRSERIADVLVDFDTLLDQDLAVRADQVIGQLMSFHTVKNIQFLADFVTARLGQIIASVIKELRIHEGNGTVDGCNFICALVFIYTEQRLIGCLGLVSRQSVSDFLIVAEHRSVQQHIIVLELAFLFRNDNIIKDIEIEGFEEFLHRGSVKSILTSVRIQRHADCLEENCGQNLSSSVD